MNKSKSNEAYFAFSYETFLIFTCQKAEKGENFLDKSAI